MEFHNKKIVIYRSYMALFGIQHFEHHFTPRKMAKLREARRQLQLKLHTMLARENKNINPPHHKEWIPPTPFEPFSYHHLSCQTSITFFSSTPSDWQYKLKIRHGSLVDAVLHNGCINHMIYDKNIKEHIHKQGIGGSVGLCYSS